MFTSIVAPPCSNVDPVDATPVVELVNELTHLLAGVRAVFAGCTTRLNLNAFYRTFEEDRRRCRAALENYTFCIKQLSLTALDWALGGS